jgi:hypothetical protein
MKCEDCIHYELCSSTYEHIFGNKYENEVETICEHFKEKSLFVELPCKVGDTVYKIMHVCGHRRIVQFEVSRISIYEKEICVFFHKSKESWHEWCTKPHHFGENIFLTREEAEKRLKGVTRMKAFIMALPISLYNTIKYASTIPFWRWL